MFRLQRMILTIILVLGFALSSLAITQEVWALESSSLSFGSRGSQVTQVQKILNNKGYWCGTADGIYGSKTQNAVIRFQKDNGIQTTGTVGPITNRALGLTNTTANVSRGGVSGRILTMVATGYDDSWESNYPYYGAPSYIGLPLARGIVATDPRVIPMGTRLYVEGYGNAIAADQGGAIKGNRIDLFFDSRSEAMQWGMKTVKVTIL